MVVLTPKPEPGLKSIDNSSCELIIDLKPIEQKVVPKELETRQQSNAGAQDQTKSATTEFDAVNGRPLVSNGVNHCNVYSNGAVDDVILGGIAIPPPVLPQAKPLPIEPEDFFDLVVLLAATPNNFIVVPFKNASEDSEFYKLKKEMYEFYEKEENKDDIPPELIKKGLFVAAKANNMWYRVEIMSVLSHNPFQVIGYLCDYGEHKTFSSENIQPLYNCFRFLPMQAIRASLASNSH